MNWQKLKIATEQYKKLAKNELASHRLTAYAVTYHSTVIEGCSLLQNQVINLLEYGKTSPTRPFEDHVMVHDHYNAFQFVEQEAKRKDLNITQEFIQQIAARVMYGTGGIVNTTNGTFDVSRGEYRLCSVIAGSRIFPDYKKVPSLMAKMCTELTNEAEKAVSLKDKCLLAFKAHYDLVSIHPFGDGNGRTARLLQNYILLHYGLPAFSVLKQDRIRYITALERAREKEDITIFFQFMFNQYIKFLKTEIRNLSR